MNQLQLQKLELELTHRERLVKEIEDLNQQTEVKYKTLGIQIDMKEEQLAILEAQYEASVQNIDEIVAERKTEITMLDNQLVEANQRLKDSQTQYKIVSENVIEAKEALKKTQEDIEERKNYLVSVEEAIEMAVENGNEQILDLNDEVGGLKADIGQLERDRLELEKDTSNKSDDLLQLEAEMADTSDAFEEEKARQEAELTAITDAVAESKKRNDEITADTSEKLRFLKEKELSLEVKVGAYEHDKEELETQKRRFNSAQRLYN